MKLEKNMYVRKKNGRIGRIKEIDERDNIQLWYLLDIKNSNFDVKCEGKHIKKASHDITDLIEAGDYVNGEKVSGFDYKSTDKRQGIMVNYNPRGGTEYIKKENIKSIVTKEQFESMQYKISLEG